MKIDELLKRLENVKIDESIVEKYEIVKQLTKKLGVKQSPYVYFIMTKDRKMRDLDSYKKLLDSNKISPNDAYVYVENVYYTAYEPVIYLYPFLTYESKESFVYAYLSKLSLSSLYSLPATGLKYIATAIRFLIARRMVVEVVDIDTATINMNLSMLIHSILSNKYIDIDKVADITTRLHSQKLFAGYDSNEAMMILDKYYEKHDTSLAKEVEAIRDAYNRIFRPYHVVYDLETKQFQVSDNNEDRRST